MSWYVIFPEEKARHGYSPKCLFDGNVKSHEAHQVAQHLANIQNKPMQIFRGKKNSGSLWTTVSPDWAKGERK